MKPFLVATGPRGHSAGGDLGWTTGLFEAMRGETDRSLVPTALGFTIYTDLRPTKVEGRGFRRGGMV